MTLIEQMAGHAKHIEEAEKALENAKMSGDSQLKNEWYNIANTHCRLAIAYATRFH